MYCLPSMRPPPDVHIGSPSELKLHLAVRPVTVCAVGLLANDLKESALKSKWEKSAFADLLRTAQRATGKKRSKYINCIVFLARNDTLLYTRLYNWVPAID